MSESVQSKPVTTIKPPEGFASHQLDQLWNYRELVYFLTWRNIKVRYKQTVLGVAWAILQPLALMVVFTLFFGKLAKVPSEGVPYPIFSFAALLPWQVLSRGITDSSESLIAHQDIITRVYFPRLIVPLSTVLASAVDFVLASFLLVGLMIFYGVVPTWNLVWLPVFVVLMVVTATGIGLWLSALNIEFRDVRHTLPFINRLLMFVSPVVYPTSMVPERWRFWYALNPIVGVIDGFRWSMLGVDQSFGYPHVLSGLVAVVLLVTGIVFFRWRERYFIDVAG